MIASNRGNAMDALDGNIRYFGRRRADNACKDGQQAMRSGAVLLRAGVCSSGAQRDVYRDARDNCHASIEWEMYEDVSNKNGGCLVEVMALPITWLELAVGSIHNMCTSMLRPE